MSLIYVFIATQTTADTVVPTYAITQADFNRRAAGALRSRQGNSTVVGDLKLRSQPNPVRGYLLCDGTAIFRKQFSELFRYLGTIEGAGDGSTTFNLPNYLGAPLAVPATAPAQIITVGGTVSVQGAQVSGPVNEGSTTGGNIWTGGNRPKLA